MTNSALRQARCERADWWLARDVELVPLQPRSKNIQPGYGSHQARITTTDFARRWFLNTDANLGIVLGGTVGLAVADWDNAQDYEVWRHRLGATIETLTEQTARGHHAFFIGVHLPPATSTTCEFKTRGVCMVAPSCHPSGVVYSVVNAASLMPLPEEKARLLFPFLSAKEVEPTRRTSPDTLNALTQWQARSGRLGDHGVVARIKKVWRVEDEIRASGVQLHPAGPGELVGLCPFPHGRHQDRQPSLWVNTLRQRWGCYAPGCESNTGGEKAHDVVNYRALSRGISNREAIRQLADEFLPPTQT